MNPESLTTFDRRGARAVGLAARPPARFSLVLGLLKITTTENKKKKHLHRILYKTASAYK